MDLELLSEWYRKLVWLTLWDLPTILGVCQLCRDTGGDEHVMSTCTGATLPGFYSWLLVSPAVWPWSADDLLDSVSLSVEGAITRVPISEGRGGDSMCSCVQST